MIHFTGKNPKNRNLKLKGIPDELSLLRLGDIICTENPMALGSAINTVSAFYSSDRSSNFTHALLMINNWKTFEATWFVESHDLFEKYEGRRVLIGRPLEVVYDRMHEALNEIEYEHRNQFYPIHRLFLHLANISQFIHWKRLVCSELVAKFLFKAGMRHHRYFGTSPDNLADEIEHQLNNERTGPAYHIVYEGLMPVFVHKWCTKCGLFHLINRTVDTCPSCNNKSLSNKENYLPKRMIKYNRKKLREFPL